MWEWGESYREKGKRARACEDGVEERGWRVGAETGGWENVGQREGERRRKANESQIDRDKEVEEGERLGRGRKEKAVQERMGRRRKEERGVEEMMDEISKKE